MTPSIETSADKQNERSPLGQIIIWHSESFPAFLGIPEVEELVCCCLVTKLYWTLLQPHGLWRTRLLFHGISQGRILEWVAMSFSRESPGFKDETHISCIGKWMPYNWAFREASLCGLRWHLSQLLWTTAPVNVPSLSLPALFFPVSSVNAVFFLLTPWGKIVAMLL